MVNIEKTRNMIIARMSHAAPRALKTACEDCQGRLKKREFTMPVPMTTENQEEVLHTKSDQR
jgi:hypothetical protein